MFRTIISVRLIPIVLAVLLSACANAQQVDTSELSSAEISNFSILSNNTYVSGQPTQDQVAKLADAGVRHVISLRTEGELDWDESELVESVGMEFHSLPVSPRDGVNSANASSLETLLASLDGQPVLVHCGSGNRVGALKAVTAHDEGASVEDALAEGRRWGLTRFEPKVRELLTSD